MSYEEEFFSVEFENPSQNNAPSVRPSGHSFGADSGIARAIGLNAAVVYGHIFYWLTANKQKSYNQHDGHTWMYQTVIEISEFFGCLSEKQVRTALQDLVSSGVLIEGNYNKNKFDRTTWYALADESLLEYSKKDFEAPSRANACNEPKRTDAKCDIPIQKENTKRPPGQMDEPSRANPTAPQGASLIRDKHQENTHKEQHKQTAQDTLDLPVNVCPLDQSVSSVCVDPPKEDPKVQAFNWMLKYGFDERAALGIIAKHTIEDISLASQYVMDQMRKREEKNETIANPLGYFVKTIEGRWWRQRKV